jgi:hypothetical protein
MDRQSDQPPKDEKDATGFQGHSLTRNSLCTDKGVACQTVGHQKYVHKSNEKAKPRVI